MTSDYERFFCLAGCGRRFAPHLFFRGVRAGCTELTGRVIVASCCTFLGTDRCPLAHALAGCGPRCATMFAKGNGALPLDKVRVSQTRVRSNRPVSQVFLSPFGTQQMSVSQREYDEVGFTIVQRSASVPTGLQTPLFRRNSVVSRLPQSLGSLQPAFQSNSVVWRQTEYESRALDQNFEYRM